MGGVLDLGCVKGCPIPSRNKVNRHQRNLSAGLDCCWLWDFWSRFLPSLRIILCFKLWLLSFLVRRSLRSIWLLGVGLDGQDEVTWAQDAAGWQISLKLLRSMNFTRGVYVLPFVLLDVLVAIGDRVTEPPPCANLSSYSHASCPADVRQPLPFKQQVTVWS